MPLSEKARSICAAQSNPSQCIAKHKRLCDQICPELELERCAQLCASGCTWKCHEGDRVVHTKMRIPGLACTQTCTGAVPSQDADEDLESPAPWTQGLVYRKDIPLMVYRNPRKLFNFQPIQDFMYGEITGLGPVDSRWRQAQSYALVDPDDE